MKAAQNIREVRFSMRYVVWKMQYDIYGTQYVVENLLYGSIWNSVGLAV